MPPDLNPASDGSSNQHSELRQHIQLSLQKARTRKTQLISSGHRYGMATLVLSAAVTLITGGSALTGDPFLGNWRLTTSIVSACTLGAAIAAGLHSQTASPGRLLESSECVAKLQDLTIETIPETYDLEAVSEAYRHILSEFIQVDG
ncbi:MAG: hypothetical protein ACFE0I_21750 [Elainellaceae cyanobacterium]